MTAENNNLNLKLYTTLSKQEVKKNIYSQRIITKVADKCHDNFAIT